MMRVSAERGMIRKVSIGNRVNISPKLIATNSLGWEVQMYNYNSGWSKVPNLPIVPTKGVAEMMMEEIVKSEQSTGHLETSEYRVYEALKFPLE